MSQGFQGGLIGRQIGPSSGQGGLCGQGGQGGQVARLILTGEEADLVSL